MDAYGVYQQLMDYWAVTMQDDCYLIAADGWFKGAQPRRIVQVRNKDNKLTWPEMHDYLQGKQRFKSDLVPAALLIARYFIDEGKALATLNDELSGIEERLVELMEEHGGEDGLLDEVIEREGDKQKITANKIHARLKLIANDPIYDDERQVLTEYALLLDRQAKVKSQRKAAQEDLDNEIGAKYPQLTVDEIKMLVVEDKWLTALSAAAHSELERVSQTLAGRIRQLAERYAEPLPQLVEEVDELSARVEEHLRRMGAVWN